MRNELCRPKIILCPVDMSEHSASAAGLVSALVRRFDSRVVVLYVLEPVDYPIELLGGGMFDTRSRAEVARGDLGEFLRKHGVEFPHELRVEEGRPAETIVRVAEEVDSDLVCMPSRGRGPFRHFLLGSTTAKVLNDAQIPVLTGAHLEDSGSRTITDLRSVVCALALDDRGKTALAAAALMARTFQAQLTVVHVDEERRSGSASERAHDFVANSGIEFAQPPNVIVCEGDVAPTLHAVAKERRADVVVIGRSTPGPLGRLRADSYAIVRSAPCPVLSV
jgi:nucleotide-binding universal stress UspA family protein